MRLSRRLTHQNLAESLPASVTALVLHLAHILHLVPITASEGERVGAGGGGKKRREKEREREREQARGGEANSRGVPKIQAAKMCDVGGLVVCPATLEQFQVSLVLIRPKFITFLVNHQPGAVS